MTGILASLIFLCCFGFTEATVNATSWFSNTTCAVRYYHIHDARRLVSCNQVKKLNNLCNQKIKIGYSELPPYLFKDQNGRVIGILPDILQATLIDTCCLGCTSIDYIEHDQLLLEHNGYVPVENGLNAKLFFDQPYTTLVNIQSVSFIGKTKRVETVNLITMLFESVQKTWSLLVVALSMAVCSGAIIWILDTWFNKTEFPRSFWKGSYEGFWWAFVSMTTVGYGDRTPHSIAARIFAVLWILIGITIFNMYTAAITSNLTAEITKSPAMSILGKEVGVLRNVTAPYSGVLLSHAHPKVYNSIESLKIALKNDEVTAVALESFMALYYMHQFKEIDERIAVLSKTALNRNGIGLVCDSNTQELIKSFAEHNEDTIDVIISESFSKISKFIGTDDVSADPYSHTNDRFTLSVVVSLSVAVGCMLIGALLAYYKAKTKRNTSKEGNVTAEIQENEKVMTIL